MIASLKEIRTSKNLTQSQVASSIGISLTSYQRIEYGRQTPSLRTAIRIADVLDVHDIRLWNCNSIG